MTQYEKIVTWMIRHPNKDWWYAPDFQKPDMPSDLFVGYEASPRMSEMVKKFPHWIDSKKDGKYRYIRFKYENVGVLPPIFRSEIDDAILAELKSREGRLL